MKSMIIVLSLSVIALLGLNYKLNQEVKSLTEVTDLLRQYVTVVNESAVSRENKIQDKLEERIGTLENNTGSVFELLNGQRGAK